MFIFIVLYLNIFHRQSPDSLEKPVENTGKKRRYDSFFPIKRDILPMDLVVFNSRMM